MAIDLSKKGKYPYGALVVKEGIIIGQASIGVCFGTIYWSNISKIVYGCSIQDSNNMLDSDINITVDELNKKTGNKIEIVGGILKDEAKQVMKDWKGKI